MVKLRAPPPPLLPPPTYPSPSPTTTWTWAQLTGEYFHAADTFQPSEGLGFTFDALPEAPPPRMREPPYFTLFQVIATDCH